MPFMSSHRQVDSSPRKAGNRMVGKILAASDAPPVSDDTGTNIPENCTAGRIVMIAAAKIAAVCVGANTEINRPKPVLART